MPSQSDFEKHLVSEYFKYGSINIVFSAHHYNLPISFAGYHRLLSKFGIVKSAGPNSRLSESLHILAKLSTYKIPLERAFHRFAPKSVQISTNTLHRILHYTRLGLTRRQGTALLITQTDHPHEFLTGFEKNTPSSSTGQKGDLALPMGHSKTGEDPKEAITRVLQHEVFTDLTIKSIFPWEYVPTHPKPIMYINIADIKVAVYHLELPDIFQFNSFKLHDLNYRSYNEIKKFQTRPGIVEICQKFLDPKENSNKNTVPEYDSNLNTALYAIAETK